MVAHDLVLDMDNANKKQAVELNPFSVNTDGDAQAVFGPEENISTKTFPQADEHGNLQDVPMVRKSI